MSAENIIVVCRCRPFSKEEINAGHTKISDIDPANGTITLKSPKVDNDIKKFTFDAVFDENCKQVSFKFLKINVYRLMYII